MTFFPIFDVTFLTFSTPHKSCIMVSKMSKIHACIIQHWYHRRSIKADRIPAFSYFQIAPYDKNIKYNLHNFR